MDAAGETGMFLKDEDATLDYCVDWSAALAGDVTIVASEWAVSPQEAGGVSVVDDGVDGAAARAWLGGGAAGHVYLVRNRVQFSDGCTDERSLTLRVEGR
jgi:hypothetical protein